MDGAIVVAIIGAGVTVGNVVLTSLISRKAKLSERGLWSASMIKMAVRNSIITKEQYAEITGKQFLRINCIIGGEKSWHICMRFEIPIRTLQWTR